MSLTGCKRAIYFSKMPRRLHQSGRTAPVAEVIIQPITVRLDATSYFSASPDPACLGEALACTLLLDHSRSRST